jgi:light-regulated signal transduction histidine kinase (bacteriophytochrome)
VRGNDFGFKQLFQKFSENAIKYNDKEKVIIEIGCSENQNEIAFFIKTMV